MILYKYPKHNTERIKRKFILRPLRIGDEIRWFEYASILQRYFDSSMEWGWKNIRFLDTTNKLEEK